MSKKSLWTPVFMLAGAQSACIYFRNQIMMTGAPTEIMYPDAAALEEATKEYWKQITDLTRAQAVLNLMMWVMIIRAFIVGWKNRRLARAG